MYLHFLLYSWNSQTDITGGIELPYDFITTEERSNLMKKIRSKDTKAEVTLAKELWKRGIRYRKNYGLLPGKPDIAITKYRIAVFVDGEFWHGYNWETKKKRIKANRDYWIKKIERNMERDQETNTKLEKSGWVVLRFWETEVKKDLEGCVQVVEQAIGDRS
jgi:DNA mismatch endonuclease (patch repair protein)